MMLGSIVRFWAMGWIEKIYLQPRFHFSYFGFEWVQPPGNFTYLLFIICGLAALLVALGLRYRLSMVVFFLSFTYIELMEKTTYLNHYYFISVLSFLLIFLPAGRYFSFDVLLYPQKAVATVPRWTIGSLKLLLGLVYFYAGLAKLNSEWLLEAKPLSIWLPARSDLFLIGPLMDERWLHYLFSWGGAIYDLAIPFLLLYRKTRWSAFALVVFFHVMTRILFPIGMFPYIMILSTLIFFSADFHQKILRALQSMLGLHQLPLDVHGAYKPGALKRKLLGGVMLLFFTLQILLPWRYTLYPGELFWHEQGYRYSWRVMLMEKAGYINYRVVIPRQNRDFRAEPSEFLTPLQEKQLAFQPDFILEFAHFLEQHYREKFEVRDVEVYADCHVALNGRASRRYIDPEIDLTEVERGWHHKNWILAFHGDIKGL